MHAPARQMAVINAAFQFQCVNGNSQASNRRVLLILFPIKRYLKEETVNGGLYSRQIRQERMKEVTGS
jgi:hypothetical protein